MYATRRAWGTALTGVLIAGLAGVIQAPFLLFVPIGIGAWLIGRQYLLFQTASQVQETVETEVVLSRQRIFVDQPLTATLTVTRQDDVPGSVTATVSAPPGIQFADILQCDISDANPADTASTELTVSAAGRYTIPPITLSITEPTGCFGETIQLETDVTVTVEPRTPRDLHIGQGGDAVASAYGDHAAGRSGSGITPAELRQYTPGDTADQIDWKATARLNEPYVREFEAETDRRTILIVDQRRSMQAGPAGQTIFSYAREAAIGAAEAAAGSDDPLGLWAVGDEGVTTRYDAATGRDHYEQVVRALRELTPTDRTSNSRSGRQLRPVDARRRAQTLSGSGSIFATTLRPYFAAQEGYVTRITNDPLFGTVQRVKATTRGTIWTVLLTTDNNRPQLQETVQQATANGDHVLVLLAPTVLFDQNQDVEGAYSAYLEFEEFRQQLDRIPRVTALEFGSGERLDRVLAARQRR